MNIVADPDAVADGEPRQSRPENTLWQHPAFCRLALPIRLDETASWQRQAASASVTITAAAGEDDAPARLPSGRYLRLLLIHAFTTALDGQTPIVTFGEDAASLAATMRLALDAVALEEFAAQCALLGASKISVSLDGATALSVFDARGRPRGGVSDWRAVLRLSSRFLEQLTAAPVPLDRRIIAALGDHSAALDAYGWIAASLPPAGVFGPTIGWAELSQRFGDPLLPPETQRAQFEECLQRVSAAWPEIRLLIGEAGVALGRSDREYPQPRPAAPLAPAPIAAPTVAAPTIPAHPTVPANTVAAVAPAEPAPVEPRMPASRPPEGTQAPPRAVEPEMSSRRPREDRVALKSHLTGLNQVLWLQRDGNGDEVMMEVTPGGRYDPQNVTVLALEPIIVQISGGLYAREFERVSAWVNANRDLIDDVWYDDAGADEEILARVKKVPPPGWR